MTTTDQNREYLVVGAEYRVVQELYETGNGGGGAQFESELDCIDAGQAFRPLPSTPVPVVRGPQTAVVVGPKGEEIWTDQSADGSGNWTYTPSTPIANGTVVNVVAQDAAGNSSPGASVTVDSQAPAAPVLNPSNGTTLSGTAEPGATVTLTDGNGISARTIEFVRHQESGSLF